jgi:serine-type D-Ala-D-Ala carboxypeptidase/endopeptidase
VTNAMCRRAFAALAALAACSPAAAPAPRPAAPSPTRIQESRWAELERFLADELGGARVPGAAVGVFADGEVAWARGFGALSVGGAPASADSRFRIGSLTKLFTGIAVLQLEERGLLRLDDPVAMHVPELAAFLSPPGEPAVTIRHLVTHTAGLPDLVPGALTRLGRFAGMSEAALLAALTRVEPLARPGERYIYSSSGVALVGIAAARAARTSYRELVDHQILRPLGMTRTGWTRVDAADSATGHVAGSGGAASPIADADLGAFDPAGGLYSTAADLLRLAAFELGARGLPGVLADERRLASQADSTLPGAAGVAWMIGTSRGERFVAHAGAVDGYAAAIVLLPERRIGAVVLLNRLVVSGAQCLALAAARSALPRARLGSRRCLGAD